MNKQTGYIQHQVAVMDESMVQRCLICGEVISDGRGMIGPKGSPPYLGYAPGAVYVRPGNPKILTIGEPDEFQLCTP